MFPSSNSLSTRDNLHYSQSQLISWCITNNCKRCKMQRGARRCLSPGAGKVAESRGATQQQQVIISNFDGSKEKEIFREMCALTSNISRHWRDVLFFWGKTYWWIPPPGKSVVNNRRKTKLGTRLLYIDFPAIESRNAEKLSISRGPQHASPNRRIASRQLYHRWIRQASKMYLSRQCDWLV